MSDTSIEWTDKTWNPTRGCSRVSPACDHCYAMREARRHDHPGGSYEGLTKVNTGRTSHPGVDWRGVVRLVPEALEIPLRWRKPQRIFVNSMSDLFHESLPPAAILAVFASMARARQHTFQVLTKRPQRMRDLLSMWVRDGLTLREGHGVALPNVWLGTSVEDPATAALRIPALLDTPAAFRFISLEPQLAQVDLAPWMPRTVETGPFRWRRGLDWVIVGGESGPGARPFDVAWARSAVAQCKAAGVPVFVKQLGRLPFDGHLTAKEMVDGSAGRPRPTDQPLTEEAASAILADPLGIGVAVEGRLPRFLRLQDRKGGDMAEWPEDLRVREFPA